MTKELFRKILGLALGVAVFLLPQFAEAGLRGCSNPPQPGDYLDCGHNGPFGPSGPNFVQCRTQCRAYRNCLNSPPVGGCAAARNALEQCCPGCHDTAYPPPPPPPPPPPAPAGALGVPQGGASSSAGSTVGFVQGVGCFLEENAYSPVSVSTAFWSAPANGAFVGAIEEECIIVVASNMDSKLAEAQELVLSVTASRLGLSPRDLKVSNDLYYDLHASWDDVRFIANDIASMSSVTVRDEVVNNMNTVGDLIDCIHSAAGSY